MHKAGVDTTDWQRINDFCRNPKIAGKAFAQLGVKDLDALQVKLRAIMGKGGLRQTNVEAAPQQAVHSRTIVAVPLSNVIGQA
jgi:hypothetical protein